MATKEKAVLKKKKKKWFLVVAKGMYNDKQIGEIPIEDAQTLMNRIITVNLMNLTGDMKKQNINLSYKIDSVDESKATAVPIGYKLNPNFIKRIVRRDKNKIEDSFTVKSQDGFVVRIKSLLMTNSKTKRSIRSELVRGSRRFLKDYMAVKNYEQFINEVIDYYVQKSLKENLHHILPLKSAEIRAIQIDKKGKITIDTKLVKQEKVKKPKEDSEDMHEQSEDSETDVNTTENIEEKTTNEDEISQADESSEESTDTE